MVKGIFFFGLYLFERERERAHVCFYLLVPFPTADNGWDWAGVRWELDLNSGLLM